MSDRTDSIVTGGGTSEILGLVRELTLTMDNTIGEINDVNRRTKMLALNAQIEAARAGQHGAAFGVVAHEMQNLAAITGEAANQMATQTHQRIQSLVGLIGSKVRGMRLSDLALTNIDLIDRNLFERTCDVRWWATDASVVDALANPVNSRRDHASGRLGTILNSYTVYFDLVLCDRDGRIIANGRPDQYRSAGKSMGREAWFQDALVTQSGDEYVFESAHRSSLVDDQPVLIYSAAVREGGRVDGKPLGVLGILFDWEGLAQTIVKQTPIAEDEKPNSRCLIADAEGNVLADSSGRQLESHLPASVQKVFEELREQPKGFADVNIDAVPHCVAYARAPGYETYSTGWNSFILQSLQ